MEEKRRIKDYQLEAVNKLQNGNILKGGTGSGKSFTSLYYYWVKVCGGEFDPDYKPMINPRPLYIITTPRKRDQHEWDREMVPFLLSQSEDISPVKVVVDSWNNIKKYVNIYGAFFIFDENRIVGSGAWVKAFLKIAKKNQWILLTATPGDSWIEYYPIFVANGFFKNKSDFREKHVEMNPFTRYPSIKRYHNVGKLIKYRNMITVSMKSPVITTQHHEDIICDYDKATEDICLKRRWHPFEDRPLRDATEMAVVMRKISFGDDSRIRAVLQLHQVHPRMIIFYDYDFELEMLHEMCYEFNINFAEWNGHKHEPVPEDGNWLYLCQYAAAGEAWECRECSTMIFFNNNYSYKKMIQAAGRIDRLNTPYKDLYYYHLTSKSYIDKRVSMALKQKKKFNELRDFRQYFD